MARKNGWQRPAHRLQIFGITVFFLLVVAFYALFVPFLGVQILEYVAIGTYTPMAFAVFILYIWCASIDTVDPGIISQFEDGCIDGPGSTATANIQGTNLPTKPDTAAGTNSPTSTCSSSLDDPRSQPPRNSRSCVLAGLLCTLFVKDDCKLDDSENLADEEDALFCTLCSAEVRKFSKHCRSCDKCVDGFDQHCRWLNNCVGRKNYFTFLALMTTSLLWLAIEIGVGIAVLVICFTNRNSEKIIHDKLGNGLPRPGFATVVVFFTLLSLVACAAVGKLFCFHMILIRKGITTYDYIVTIRAMSQSSQEEEDLRTMSEAPPQVEENHEEENIVCSPANSAITGFSHASSLGLDYKGSWWTLPKISVDTVLLNGF